MHLFHDRKIRRNARAHHDQRQAVQDFLREAAQDDLRPLRNPFRDPFLIKFLISIVKDHTGAMSGKQACRRLAADPRTEYQYVLSLYIHCTIPPLMRSGTEAP